MKLVALEIPEEPAARVAWLESQLVGVDLADLTAQLSLYRPTGEPASLNALLAGRLSEVLQSGLRSLPVDDVDALLDNPGSLLDLQTRILLEGGEYWNRLAAEANPGDALGTAPTPSKERATRLPSTSPRVYRRRGAWLVALAVAASSAAVAAFIWPTRPATVAWGFKQSGLFERDLEPHAYLQALSTAAEQWFNKAPADLQALQQRLQSFREGCDELLAAGHPQLPPDDRNWLLARCAVWRDSIDARLREIAAGRLAATEIRKRSDALVRQIVDELNRRAAA